MDGNNLYIAASSPDLNFNITKTIRVSDDVKGNDKFYSVSNPVALKVTRAFLSSIPKYS